MSKNVPLSAEALPAEISPGRATLDRWIVAVADPLLTGFTRHWLFAANLLTALFLVGAVAAPLLTSAGITGAADALYSFYASFCHQWAFRSFFLFGPQVVYPQGELAALGVDPWHYIGDPGTGWKLALCERDFAIYAGALVFGLMYAMRWRSLGLRPASYLLYALLILPIAIDGLSQLPGTRESTWELRLATGLLFGLASGWALYPRLQQSFSRSLSG